ncbi:MAG: ABC transporter ATP-binding protein [Clostridia bacterium]|nr:ABC transporter ATP-binding protein [Clostridia bacterium]
MSKLECIGVSKAYGGHKVLKDISLCLEEHRIYGLIGRNGAGKTTLLSLLSGQTFAAGGQVLCDGEPVWENQDALDKICFSREISKTTFFGNKDRMTSDMLKAGAYFYPGWDEDYARELTDIFELDTDKKITELSDGMRSALTIVMALASQAPITFLDEPVAGLDVFMRDRFYKLLLEEYCESERTFVVSTHIIDEATSLLEDVIILDRGKIVCMENTEELLERHRMVSGLAEDIDRFCEGRNVVHSETLGRKKTVCVAIDDMAGFRRDAEGYDFDISKASLQKLFMNLL